MSSPHSTKRFSNPIGSGSGRFLYIASALSKEVHDKIVFPWKKARMEEIHARAKKITNSRRHTGPLEQYMLLHSGIQNNSGHLKERLKDFNVVFVTGVSTDILAVREKQEMETGTLKEEYISSAKMGFSFYSDSNTFSTRLLDLELRLKDFAEQDRQKDRQKEFPEMDKKPRLYVVVGPFVAMGYLHEHGFRDILLDDIISEEGAESGSIAGSVDDILLGKKKSILGRMQKSAGDSSFQSMHYRFSEAFFDSKKAANTLELPKDMGASEFKTACSEHTFYNRLVASYMYKSLLDLVPGQQEFLIVASESSYAMKITERALRMARKDRVPLKIMDGTFIPLDGEANKTAMNRVGGYLRSTETGRRKSLNTKEFFGK